MNKLTCSLLGLSSLMSMGASAATCSCAGVPLLNSMNNSTPKGQSWYLSTTYEYHKISDLYSGSDEVNDETGRDRVSQSTLFEVGYGINENWSVTGLLSATKHERTIGTNANSHVDSSGFGDAVILFKYSPQRITVYNRWQYAVGAGAKIPLGEDNATNNGITLSEDMQPSTGAWSALYWGYVARSFSAQANWELYGSFNYSDNQENDRNYQFGNELNVTFGVVHQDESPWDFGAGIRYRTTEADKRNGNDIANTGGSWWTLLPTIAYSFDENLALSATARIPIHRDLDGELQFTTSWATSLTLTYLF